MRPSRLSLAGRAARRRRERDLVLCAMRDLIAAMHPRSSGFDERGIPNRVEVSVDVLPPLLKARQVLAHFDKQLKEEANAPRA